MAKEFERILVPTDGSAVAKRAAHKAFTLARATGVDVIAMHVIDIPGLPALYGFPDELPYEQLHDLIQKPGRSYLDEFEELGDQNTQGSCVVTSRDWRRRTKRSVAVVLS